MKYLLRLASALYPFRWKFFAVGIAIMLLTLLLVKAGQSHPREGSVGYAAAFSILSLGVGFIYLGAIAVQFDPTRGRLFDGPHYPAFLKGTTVFLRYLYAITFLAIAQFFIWANIRAWVIL